MESKDIKNCTCYYFVDIMKARDIDSGFILLDEKIYKNILIHDISYKFLWVQNNCVFSSIKSMDLLKFMMALHI